jgi:hypothetical protein
MVHDTQRSVYGTEGQNSLRIRHPASGHHRAYEHRNQRKVTDRLKKRLHGIHLSPAPVSGQESPVSQEPAERRSILLLA